MIASELHKATVNAKPPYTVTGIIIHKLAASLFKPRGSNRGKKVAAYSPEITVGKIRVQGTGGWRRRLVRVSSDIGKICIQGTGAWRRWVKRACCWLKLWPHVSQ